MGDRVTDKGRAVRLCARKTLLQDSGTVEIVFGVIFPLTYAPRPLCDSRAVPHSSHVSDASLAQRRPQLRHRCAVGVTSATQGTAAEPLTRSLVQQASASHAASAARTSWRK